MAAIYYEPHAFRQYSPQPADACQEEWRDTRRRKPLPQQLSNVPESPDRAGYRRRLDAVLEDDRHYITDQVAEGRPMPLDRRHYSLLIAGGGQKPRHI